MIQRIDFRGRELSARELRAALPRAEFDIEAAIATVQPIVSDVRDRGAAALRDYAERFDGIRPEQLRVSGEAIAQALASIDSTVRAGLEETIRRVRTVHAAQLPVNFTTVVSEGAEIRQRWIPVARVGLYVPGGLAVYPTSVVMNVVAAQEAGVPSLAVASPPQKEYGGLPHPTILAACALLGVDEVYAVGGAQAIGMFAYGADGALPQDGDVLCEPVDVITGPGNVWVAAAKRLVLGVVGIDAEAGPTEIAILADDSADPSHVALDLVSQAEHDPLAASVLVTDSIKLADQVAEICTKLVEETKHTDRIREALGGQQSGIVLVDDIEQGLRVVNAYGAEHLEIQTLQANAMAERVQSAGAIFVGPYSPVPLGDYISGSNHVLPTGGVAAYSSGLGVHSFLRAVQVIEYTQDALREVSEHIVALANAEDLPAHGEAVRLRF